MLIRIKYAIECHANNDNDNTDRQEVCVLSAASQPFRQSQRLQRAPIIVP